MCFCYWLKFVCHLKEMKELNEEKKYLVCERIKRTQESAAACLYQIEFAAIFVSCQV